MPFDKTALLVENEEAICRQLTEELQRNSFAVLIADNIHQAYELLTSQQVDIVLADIELTNLNDVELLKKIKSKRASIEVILLTDPEHHNIAIESLRNGAIDYFEKPVNTEELSTIIGRAAEKIAKNKNQTYKNNVLIIDDNQEVVERLRKILEKENYTTFGAYSGLEGIETIKNNRIDAMVTDIKMADISGIEVLERVKKLYQDIEVIMVTGYDEQELAVRALKAGAIDYLHKPVNLEELIHAINKAVEKVTLYRSRLYQNRELKLNAEIIARMNEELEKLVVERTTQLSQTQAQLIQSEKMAAIGCLAAGIAHEINNPLTAITMNIAFLADLIKGDEKLEKKLRIIEKEADRASEIVKGLLTFSRQSKQTDKKPTDIHQIIENTLKPIEQTITLANIKVIREFAAGLEQVLINANQIQQVFLNLINNACDAMPKGGQINIRTKKISEGKIVVEFSDTGSGIPSESISKIFDPFYTTKSPGKGTGLGLTVSYEIIKNHNGELEVTSEIGKGTTFYIKLPV